MPSMLILDQIRAVVVGLTLALWLVLVCIFAIPFKLKKRLKLVNPSWRLAARLSMRHAAQAVFKVSEDRRSESFKSQGDVGLIIANHQSFIDIPVIVTMLQAPPIMKKEVLYIPFIGFLGWICGAIPVSRSNMGSKRKVLDLTKKRLLEDKIGVQVYPEGTRSKTGKPAAYEKIARALLVLAYKEKVPVTPTSIYGTRGVVNSMGVFTTKTPIGIIVHEEVYPEKFESADAFSRACWEKVVKGYEELTTRIALPNKN